MGVIDGGEVRGSDVGFFLGRGFVAIEVVVVGLL